jgi:aspartate racemase
VKTIGVLGGIGPQATMDFETRVHRVSRRLIPPSRNAGYPPMVVYYLRHAPFLLTEEGTPQRPLRLDPRLLETVGRLGSVADFLVITSNGPHLLLPEIEQAAGRRVLSMVAVTLNEVQRRRWKRVGVLGLGDPVIYTRPLAQLGIACEIADTGAQAALDGAIFQVMEGRDDAASAAIARSAVADLRSRGVEGVILGCTEIPFLIGEAEDDASLINPMQLLAEAAVRVASMDTEWIS